MNTKSIGVKAKLQYLFFYVITSPYQKGSNCDEAVNKLCK